MAKLKSGELSTLNAFWEVLAHYHQCEPGFAANDQPWTTWLLLGGRGAGKTRAGAEWVRRAAENKISPIALVGETEHDAREVMIEGISGLAAVHGRLERPLWIPSRRRLEWRNGVFAQAFSADDPESLRGPQFAAAWCDELADGRSPDRLDALVWAVSALTFATRGEPRVRGI